jgi:hypothetical protein
MIERIEALCEAATPGIWLERNFYPDFTAPDAQFIAHARQLLPLMLEVVEAQDAYLRAHNLALRNSDEPGVWVNATEATGELERRRQSLEAYCAEHLPEGSKG